MIKYIYLGGEIPHSLVKILQFCRFPMGSNSALGDYLFVGTHGSVLLIHHILNNIIQKSSHESEKNYKKNNLQRNINFPLIKEIRLRHGAPIVNIEVIQVCFFFFSVLSFLGFFCTSYFNLYRRTNTCIYITFI